MAPTTAAPLPDALTLSHHLWTKVTELTHLLLRPFLTGRAAPSQALPQGGNQQAPGMFSCSPGQEKAQG